MRQLAVVLLLCLLAASGCTLGPSRHAPPVPRPTPSMAPSPARCGAGAGGCGYPDATNTGVPAGTKLRTVPGQVSSGPGWSYSAHDHAVHVTGNGAVLSGLNIPYVVSITASHVTIKDDKIVTGGAYAVEFRHTSGVTVEDDTVSGLNTGSGRVDSAVADLYGNSTGMVIEDNNISMFRCGVQVSSGLVAGNYIHDPGYIPGDHTNGIIAKGGAKPLMIYHNTILIDLSQTDAVTIDDLSSSPVANKTIEDNLLAGGGYPIYGGAAFGAVTSNIRVEDNRFAQVYYRRGGQFGPVAYFDPRGKGNIWSGNTWLASGRTVMVPDRPARP